MSRLRRQDGATLVLMLGVAATLAILGLSLVVLLTNSMGNTKRDIDRTKSLHIAEAGVDAAQNLLAQKWPADNASKATSTDWTLVYDKFNTDYPASEFQRPKTAGFVSIRVYDDITDTDPLLVPADTDPSIDFPRNNIMVVESQAPVGGARTRIQVKVNRLEYNLQILEGVALYAQGPAELKGTGSGNSYPIYTDDPLWPATAYTQSTSPYPNGYNISGNAIFPTPDGLISQKQDPAVTAASIFPTEIVEQMRIVAENAKPSQKYSELKVESVLKGLEPKQDRVAWVTGDVQLASNQDFFSEDKPGLLIVDGNLDFTGGMTFWGVIYAPNGTVTISGGPQVHGMVIAASFSGNAKLSGNRALTYNQNVIANLNKMVTLVVRLVPGTWREIHPK